MKDCHIVSIPCVNFTTCSCFDVFCHPVQKKGRYILGVDKAQKSGSRLPYLAPQYQHLLEFSMLKLLFRIQQACAICWSDRSGVCGYFPWSWTTRARTSARFRASCILPSRRSSNWKSSVSNRHHFFIFDRARWSWKMRPFNRDGYMAVGTNIYSCIYIAAKWTERSWSIH